MTTLEIRVPDIGDFADVPVIDVLVAPGDAVAVEDPIVTLESEKATIDVPSPSAGIVASVAVKAGDTVSEGSVLLVLGLAEPDPARTPPVVSATATAPADPATVSADGAAPPLEPQRRDDRPARLGAIVELRVPDLGGFSDVAIVEVLVRPGDRIAVEAPLVSLESDKATMEVPASAAGVVRDVAVRVGDLVSEGSLLATLVADSDGGAAPSREPARPGSTSGAAVGDAGDARIEAAATRADVVEPPSPTVSAAPLAAAAGTPVATTVHASPAVRRFARELGAPLGEVRGSGPHGRVTREDVQGYVKARLAAPPAAPPAAAGRPAFLTTDLPALPRVDFAKYGPVERVPLSRLKKLAGANLHRNWLAIPHVTNHDEADVTELEALRKTLNAERPGAKVTLLAFAMLAAVAALREHPDVNASLDGDELVRKRYYAIGFAADTPGGLVVPVVRDVDRKGVFELAAESAALAAKARAGELSAAEMTGATFTISSLGGIGGTAFTPIVNAPEVAILGLSRTATKPVWDGSAFVPRLMLPLSLSYDHRAIDGALAARFNATLARVLGDLRRALL